MLWRRLPYIGSSSSHKTVNPDTETTSRGFRTASGFGVWEAGYADLQLWDCRCAEIKSRCEYGSRLPAISAIRHIEDQTHLYYQKPNLNVSWRNGHPRWPMVEVSLTKLFCFNS